MLTCFPKLPQNFQLVQNILAEHIPHRVAVKLDAHENQSPGNLLRNLNLEELSGRNQF